MDALISFFRDVILKCLTIFHSCLPGGGDDHCLGLATQLLHDRGAEMLHNNFDALGNVGVVQFYKSSNLPLGCIGFASGIILDFLIDLVESRVFCVILQYIQNEAFFDSLPHGIDMECLPLTLRVQAAK